MGKAKKKNQSIVKKFPAWAKNLSALITALATIGGAVVGCTSWIVEKVSAATNEKFDSISVQLESLERDSARSQLLTLMSGYPENTSEILKVAYHYFKELDGDWYMTELFLEWASEHNIDASGIVEVHGEK